MAFGIIFPLTMSEEFVEIRLLPLEEAVAEMTDSACFDKDPGLTELVPAHDRLDGGKRLLSSFKRCGVPHRHSLNRF
jgi:hypothetical protein